MCDLGYLQAWLADREGGNNELQGPGSAVWFTKDGDDFKLVDKLSLSPGFQNRDAFTRIAGRTLARVLSASPMFRRKVKVIARLIYSIFAYS